MGIDVFVNGNNVVWLPLEEPKGPIEDGTEDNADASVDVEPAVPLSKLLVDPSVRLVEFVRGNSVVSVAPVEAPVVTGIEADEPVNGGVGDNPVLSIESVGPFGHVAVIVAFERGYGTEDPVLVSVPLLGPPDPVPVIEVPVVLAPILATELVAVKDSSELGIVKPDDGRLKVPPVPVDGDVKLPVPSVELVN